MGCTQLKVFGQCTCLGGRDEAAAVIGVGIKNFSPKKFRTEVHRSEEEEKEEENTDWRER